MARSQMHNARRATLIARRPTRNARRVKRKARGAKRAARGARAHAHAPVRVHLTHANARATPRTMQRAKHARALIMHAKRARYGTPTQHAARATHAPKGTMFNARRTRAAQHGRAPAHHLYVCHIDRRVQRPTVLAHIRISCRCETRRIKWPASVSGAALLPPAVIVAPHPPFPPLPHMHLRRGAARYSLRSPPHTNT